MTIETQSDFDDGQCDWCDGTGHDPDHDGRLCRKCLGSGRLDDEDDEGDEDEAIKPQAGDAT